MINEMWYVIVGVLLFVAFFYIRYLRRIGLRSALNDEYIQSRSYMLVRPLIVFVIAGAVVGLFVFMAIGGGS